MCVGGGGAILVSLRPSVPVRPSRIPCPLCSAYSSGWIQFILIHIIYQFNRVCRVEICFQHFKIWIFGNFFKSVPLTLFCFGIWFESLLWVIMGRQGVSQNAGVLVVIVETTQVVWWLSNWMLIFISLKATSFTEINQVCMPKSVGVHELGNFN